MNKQNNNKWFSIVLAMWITIIIGMISILILEYIVPFSRNIKWVENSSAAYYHWYGWIEESLWILSQSNTAWTSSGKTMTASATWSSYNLVSNTSIIPPAWKGNSDYDSNWNRFDSNTPIQLQLPLGVDFTNTVIKFRIPNIDRDTNPANNGTFTWSSTDPMINWILTWLEWSNPVSLNASGSYITKWDINVWTELKIWNKTWLSLENQNCTLQEFYTQSCSWSWITSNSTLKLSLIDKLELDTWNKIIPYLEYQMDFKQNATTSIEVPGRYSQINTVGKSYGYKKYMDIKVPQLSTNQAFDFTVFQ
jgi:hypothetical protein